MMGINHAAMGGALWLAATTSAEYGLHLHVLEPTTTIAGAFVCAGAALLADADHHNATIAHSAPGMKGATAVVGKLSGGHRHGTHSLLALALVTLGSVALGWLRWDVPGVGTIPVGVGIATVLIVGFGLRAMKIMRGSWWRPFLGGLGVALMVMALAPGGEWAWFPWAVGAGYAIHLIGDFLTTGGLVLFWPLVPKPPKAWQKAPILSRLWMKNGYMALPILGNAGSWVEYALSIISYVYFAYGIFHESAILATQGASAVGAWWEALLP